MVKLLFYTTSGCHLCEQAEQLLLFLQSGVPVDWQAVDISTDPLLVEEYGIRIPVLKRSDNNCELGWPFDYATLQQFVSAV